MRQGCAMSPWLFNIFMDGCFREMKSKVVNAGAKLRLNGEVWSVVTCFFADDTVLLAESEGDLQRVVNEFHSVCERRKLKVNAGKSKMMVLERREEEVVDFNIAYRVRLPTVARCRVMLGSEKMEEVSEFKYLGTLLCKHGGNGRRNTGASDERQECCGFARWGNEREKCVYGCEEGLKE